MLEAARLAPDRNPPQSVADSHRQLKNADAACLLKPLCYDATVRRTQLFLTLLGITIFAFLSARNVGNDNGDRTPRPVSLAGWVPSGWLLQREISAEERRKRELFLRAREHALDIQTATPTPTPRATPRPTPKATPRATPRSTPRPTPTPKPQPRQTATPEPRATPIPVYRGRLISTPTPEPTPPPADKEKGAVVVQKSGHLEQQGYEPPPKKEKQPGLLSRIFGGGGNRYRYLTEAVRKEIDRPNVRRERWKYIIIHNSGTRSGNARIFGHYHKNVRKMENGLAYHFVIGNGSKSGNGQIEIGDRWRRQINGGHVASDYLNNIAIGICLVGDFNRDTPTQAQLDSLEELVDYLRKRVGKIEGKRSIVKAHKDINPRPTDCPGEKFPYRWLRGKFD